MNSIERRRPVTRRRRLAHLGVGGVIVAATSAHLVAAQPEPVQAAATAPVSDDLPLPLAPKPALPKIRAVAHRASRSEPRRPIVTPIPTDWAGVAACESGGDWDINTGNGYYGGLQEGMTFWAHYGGLRFAARPDLATPAAQVLVADRGLAVQGWGAWPVCGR